MNKFYNYISIFLVGFYGLILYFNNKLGFLIHTRFVWLTICASVLLIAIGALGAITQYQKYKSSPTGLKFGFGSSFWIMVVAIMVFFVPIRTLSSESFVLRSTNNNFNLTESEKSDVKLKLKSSLDSTTFKFFDWINAKSLNQPNIFKDKKVKIVGILMASPDPKIFNLSRFVISCCIVDATPASLFVEYDYSSKFKIDEWVEVEGTFVLKPVNNQLVPVIIPTSVTKIEVPNNVYIENNN
jgi:uncharacterized repeat protein (TIGR03943 family)